MASMLDDEVQLKKLLKDLFRVQLFASLATIQSGRPYNNLIAYAVTDDLRSILFVTKRDSRKYANLVSNSNVSVLIDSRSNQDSDFRNAMAVTASGAAEEVRDSRKETMLQLFLIKHRSLEKFANSPQSALFIIRVKKYFIVRNFQEVVELKIE
jgi:heme iron utilization protein